MRRRATAEWQGGGGEAPARLALTESARAVLQALAEQGAITRPQLGTLLALSKPTMSAAVAELESQRLVAARGIHKGATGRSAKIYGLGPAAGFVVGVDVGATQLRAIASGLDDRPLGAASVPAPPGLPPEPDSLIEIVTEVTDAATTQRAGALRALAVALPRSISERRMEDSIAVLGEALTRLRSRLNVPIILENNVNCAAIAEHRFGAAQDCDIFAYLQIGVRIGLGLIVDGRLFRGADGFAGEIGRIPFPWSESAEPQREGLEHYLGAEALIGRVGAAWPEDEGPAPESARQLFDRAASGSEAARLWVERHAQDIGRLAAACVGMFDPGRILLGGGVGQNPALIGEVTRVVRELTWPTDIAVTTLGDDATALGAMRIASQFALAQMIDQPSGAIVLPPLGRRRSA